MEKLKYQEQKEQILASIKALEEEKNRLTSRYIELNKKFSEGDKVEVMDHYKEKHIAFISKIFVDHKDEVSYKFYKCKKDGTPSMHELWMWSFNSIKKIK